MVFLGRLGVDGEVLVLALIVSDDVVIEVFTRTVIHIFDGGQAAALLHLCSILLYRP